MASTSTGEMSTVVYIKHIPDGFFEPQMKGYFSQFGKVNRVKMARSVKTGRSKGFGFVDFADVEVAKVAAKTMDNYLMFEKKLQCRQIPSSELKPETFKFWNKGPYISRQRKISAQRYNKMRTEEQVQKIACKAISKFKKRNKSLAAAGIDYQFKLPQNKRKNIKTEVKTEDEIKFELDHDGLKSELELDEKLEADLKREEILKAENLDFGKVKSEPESDVGEEKDENPENRMDFTENAKNLGRKSPRKKALKDKKGRKAVAVSILPVIPKFKGTASLKA